MAKNGKRYSDEFKQQLVDLHNTGSTVENLSKEYNIALGTIYNWINLYSDKGLDYEKNIIKENQELKKNNIELKMQVEAFKKILGLYL